MSYALGLIQDVNIEASIIANQAQPRSFATPFIPELSFKDSVFQ